MSKIIGIDLGTTNSCVAIYENGKYNILPNQEGAKTTPSMVGFTKDDILVGDIAKRQSITNAKNTLYGVKRLIGRKYDSPEVQEFIKNSPFEVIKNKNGDAWVKVDGKEMSPEEVGSHVVKKLKKVAEDYLGEEVKEVVITVPAYFNDAQRNSTKNIGKLAGLEVKRIINEPTSAALAYGNENKKDRNLAIFDFGGGTFDISILETTEDGVFEVKATNGDTYLGGENIDEVVLKYVLDEFKESEGIDLSNDGMAMQRLREAVEKAKKELSSTITTQLNIPFITANEQGPKHLNMELTRSKFESLISDILDKLTDPCLTCIKDSGLSVEEIDEVILVGGSTRIPSVQDKVKSIFKKEPSKGVNPDEVVAAGAAVQGGVLQGTVNDVLLLDVTPLSLGLETMGGVMTKIIDKNTTIPCKKSQVFSTAQDNQPAVSIHVLQGEREFAKDNKTLGNFDLTGINPAPRGVPQIEVSFDIDANGIIKVTAIDKATNKEQNIVIKDSSGLSEEEITRIVQEAEIHAESDKLKRELVDKRNGLESLIFNVEKMLNENKDNLKEEDLVDVNKSLEKSKSVLKSESLEEVSNTFSELEKTVHELSSKMYQQPSEEKVNESPSNDTSKKEDDDIVDAEYKAV